MEIIRTMLEANTCFSNYQLEAFPYQELCEGQELGMSLLIRLLERLNLWSSWDAVTQCNCDPSVHSLLYQHRAATYSSWCSCICNWRAEILYQQNMDPTTHHPSPRNLPKKSELEVVTLLQEEHLIALIMRGLL